MKRILFTILLFIWQACAMNVEIETFISNNEATALNDLANGELEKFDPFVADQGCQVRALVTCILFQAIAQYGSDRFTESEKKFLTISTLLNTCQIISLDAHGRRHIKLDTKKLNIPITGKIKTKLPLLLQQYLAQESVTILQKLALENNDTILQRALSYTLLDDPKQFKRIQCACYPGMKMVLNVLLNLKIPILIRSFTPNNLQLNAEILYTVTNDTYCQAIDKIIDPKTPLFIIDGYSQIHDKTALELALAQHDFFDVILAIAATHKQFSGLHSNDDVPYDSLEISALRHAKETHKEYALHFGCCLENDTLFVIRHIYAGSIKNFSLWYK